MSWIVEDIQALGGSVPFDRYMELALYHPVHGYYSAASPRYGRTADYLTAPTASEWYPRVVARLMRGLSGPSGPLQIVDVAAGDGSFVAGLVEALGDDAAAVVSAVAAVERSESMRTRIFNEGAGDRIRVVGDLADFEPDGFPTVIHASEFYDAQPVARVVGRSNGLREQWVGVHDGDLALLEREPRAEVVSYFANHGIALEEGQIAEANLEAESTHLRTLQAVGADGLALVLDYGYDSSRLYNARGRRSGSLATFCRHRVGRDPLQSPGEVDLTAHVNWDDLRLAGREAGWKEIGLWPLAEFLVRAGLADELDERGFGIEAEIDAATFLTRQEVKRLLDPDGMGSDLKMLVQAKGAMIDIASKLLAMSTEF